MADSPKSSAVSKAPTLPAELWAVVLSNLLPSTGSFAEESAASATRAKAGTAELAKAMRVNAEWHDIITLLLYNRTTTSDLDKLLAGFDNAPISGLRSKRHSCALVKHLRIVVPPVDPNDPDLVPDSPIESDTRLDDMRRVRALNFALDPQSQWRTDGTDTAPSDEMAEVQQRMATIDLGSSGASGAHAGDIAARPFSSLRSVDIAFSMANRTMYIPDRFSHLNAIQLLSPDQVCLHYEGVESAVEVPLADPRRDPSDTQNISVHLDRIDVPATSFMRENRLPILKHGQTRWTIDCTPSADVDSSNAAAQLAPFGRFIDQILFFSLHRAPPRWGRLHIDFVLPSLQAEATKAVIERVEERVARVQRGHRYWLSTLHPNEVMDENGYHLTWAFVEKVVCGACGEVVGGDRNVTGG